MTTRKGDVGNLMLGRPTKLSDKSLRGAYVVNIPEIFLQSLQPLHQSFDQSGVEQRPRGVHPSHARAQRL